jgi:hypothetical protein
MPPEGLTRVPQWIDALICALRLLKWINCELISCTLLIIYILQQGSLPVTRRFQPPKETSNVIHSPNDGTKFPAPDKRFFILFLMRVWLLPHFDVHLVHGQSSLHKLNKCLILAAKYSCILDQPSTGEDCAPEDMPRKPIWSFGCQR